MHKLLTLSLAFCIIFVLLHSKDKDYARTIHSDRPCGGRSRCLRSMAHIRSAEARRPMPGLCAHGTMPQTERKTSSAHLAQTFCTKPMAMRKSLRATSKPIHNERNDGATLPYQHASKVMLGHDSKVKQVVVSIVLHEMAMAHGAIMALARAACLHLTIIMERGHATDNIYDLAVLLVCVQTCRSARTKGGIHNLHLIIGIITCVQRTVSSFEVHLMNLCNLIKINYHLAKY